MMNELDSITILQGESIYKAIEKITKNRKQFILVTNDSFKLLGIVTDGDIRRGVLKGVTLDECVEKIMNPDPFKAKVEDTKEKIFDNMKANSLHQCPVVDSKNKVIRVDYLENFNLKLNRDNWIVIMAGGLGKRLHPLTEDIPKPLVEVKGKPMLETIILELKKHGFRNIYLTVNHKFKMIEEYFGDGSQYGVNIKYVREKKRLGTAGSLSLLEELPKLPLIVMNCDLVTNINYSGLLNFHQSHNSVATMCVKEYDFEIPYGVAKIEHGLIVGLEEKPSHRCYINAGIYVLNPEIIKLVPKNKYYDMTQFFENIIMDNISPSAFPVLEEWIDVGSLKDWKQANFNNNKDN